MEQPLAGGKSHMDCDGSTWSRCWVASQDENCADGSQAGRWGGQKAFPHREAGLCAGRAEDRHPRRRVAGRNSPVS